MATHSGILGWRVPWTEKPGRQRVGTGLKRQHTHTHTHTHKVQLKSCIGHNDFPIPQYVKISSIVFPF